MTMAFVYMPWVSSEWLTLATIATGLILVAFQVDRLSRRRMLMAAALVCAMGVYVLAEDAIVMDPCYWLEPYSWEWWFWSCWM